MYRTVNDITAQGFPMVSLLHQLHEDVILSDKLSDTDKSLICEKIAQVCIFI